jgi:hypothetical protein
MEPDKVATHLRNIAAKIDNSKRPDPSLVAADIRKILAAIGAGPVYTVLRWQAPDGSLHMDEQPGSREIGVKIFLEGNELRSEPAGLTWDQLDETERTAIEAG